MKVKVYFTIAMPDPNLEIKGGAWSSRPLDKGGGDGHQKKIFSALRESVWSKNKGGGGFQVPPLDPPLNCHGKSLNFLHCEWNLVSQFSDNAWVLIFPMDYLKSDMGARNKGSSARLVLSSARLARVHLKLTPDLSFLKFRVSSTTGVRVVSSRVRRLIAAEMIRDSKSSQSSQSSRSFLSSWFPSLPGHYACPDYAGKMLEKCLL